MFYRGKHHKKRFKPAVEEYKTQLIFYWICFKRKAFQFFGWWIGLIDKHDEWWDNFEEKWDYYIQRCQLFIGYKVQKITKKYRNLEGWGKGSPRDC